MRLIADPAAGQTVRCESRPAVTRKPVRYPESAASTKRWDRGIGWLAGHTIGFGFFMEWRAGEPL